MSSHVTSWVLELVDNVSSPFKKINRWAKMSYGSVSKLDKRLDVLKNRSSNLTKALTKLTIIGVGLFMLARGSLAFSNGLAKANTMMDLGDAKMVVYRNSLQDLSTETGKAKTELVDGLYKTISAGVSKENSLTFLRDSAKAAVAGTAEIGVVIESVKSYIDNYGESLSNASLIQDKFQKTIKLGMLDGLGELGSVLPRVTNMSAQLGVTQNELLGIFATGSGKIGKAAEVSTMLGATLNAFIKPSSEAVKMAKELEIAFDARSIQKAGGLKNYIDELMPRITAYSKKSGIAKEQIIGSMFGSAEAIKMVMALGGNLNESWANNTKEIANSAGSVQAAFDIMQKDTTVKMAKASEGFSNNLDTIVTSLKPLTDTVLNGVLVVAKFTNGFMRSHPTLTKVVTITGGLVFGLTALSVAAALVSTRIRMMGVMLQITAIRGGFLSKSLAKATLGTLSLGRNMLKAGKRALIASGKFVLMALQGLGSFVVSMITATAAQWGFNIAMSANPIGLVIIGIAALVGIIVLLAKKWDWIKAKIKQFGKFVMTYLMAIFPQFSATIFNIFHKVFDFIKRMIEKLKGVITSIKSFFGFGETTKSEITVKDETKKKTDPKKVLDKLEKDKETDIEKGLLTDKTTEVGGTGTGSGKTISMTLNVYNTFKMAPGNWRDSLDDIADEIIGKLNDGLKDGLITAG